VKTINTFSPFSERHRERRLNPLNDFLFLKIMSEKGDEVQLLSFLNAVLGRSGSDRIVSVNITENKSLSADYIGSKSCILDLRARLDDGTRVNIEVQVSNQKNIDRRTLYYWSREFSRSLQAGEDYLELPRVIAINIVDFRFLKTEKYHTVFHLWEDTEKDLLLTDALEIRFVDMVQWRKLGKKDIEHDPLERWLAWIDRQQEPERAKEAAGMDSGIAAADARLNELVNDEEFIRLYELRWKAQLDWNNSINSAHREGEKSGLKRGLKKGLNQGLEQGRTEIARNALKEGAGFEFVQKITGLPLETIEKL
jgi:predicted transposase/invertase (TIGR01784 family)